MNRIKELRLAKGVTQQQLAEMLGLKSLQSISYYENGSRPLSARSIKIFCNFFNVSPAYLLGESTNKNNTYDIEPIKLSDKVAIYGSVSAGMPVFCDENIEGYTYLADIQDTSEVFCLRVDGNSMNLAGLPNNSLAIVHKQSIVENGDIAVVRVNENEALIKRFHRDGTLIHLIPESTDSQFKELTYDLMKTSVYIIGKVIGSQIRF